MPSASLTRWQGERRNALDEIEDAHRGIGGGGRGRRYATEQLNHSYTVLLSSQFQGFCRDLFLECVDHLAKDQPSATMRTILRRSLALNLKLGTGNPNPGNIGSDYNRLGLSFWDEVQSLDLRNQDRQNRLIELNVWRNAIAHQDFDPIKLGPGSLRLRAVRRWRAACDRLAESFDEVMKLHIESIAGSRPW